MWKDIARELCPPIMRRAFRKRGEVQKRVSLAAQLRAQYPDFDQGHLETIEFVHSHTMTSPERIHALIEAIKYVVRRCIPGAIVECGVWRGGSIMAAARTLLMLGATDRDLYI